MTLAASYTPAKYDCNGSTTSFAFNYPFFAITDLIVYTINDTTGISTTLEYGSGAGKYTIYAANNDYSSGCTVITGSTYATGTRLVIERSIPYGQGLDINGDFVPAEPLEQQLDKLAAQIQQIKERLDRTIYCPVTDSPDLNYTVSNEVTRAGKAIGFDATTGAVTELSIASEGGAFTAVDTNSGLTATGGTIAAKVDDSTIAFSSGNIAIKAGGVGTTQIADDAVTTAKITSPTGTDTNVVTGTKGTNGNFAKWDANGDIIDSTFAAIDEDNMASDSATKVPTQQSVKAYVDAVDSARDFTPTTYGGEESVTFPNGLVMKMGTASLTSGAVTITFAAAFGTAIVSVTASPTDADGTVNANGMILDNVAKTGFDFAADTNCETMYWIAIGY